MCTFSVSFAGHPPPGDFIALGSKGQAGESKTASALLKPTAPGLPSERKREASAALPGASLAGLAKRPKLPSTPPLSALGRLAEAAVAEKRAISPSIKEPSVVPIEGKIGLQSDRLVGKIAHRLSTGLWCGAAGTVGKARVGVCSFRPLWALPPAPLGEAA
jgi:hypothetical protein